MTYWILLRDWTARVCEGKGLRSVDAYLKGEGIPEENVLAVICWWDRPERRSRGRLQSFPPSPSPTGMAVIP